MRRIPHAPPISLLCRRAITQQAPRRALHSSSTGDLAKFIPNTHIVDRTSTTELQPYKYAPTERFKDLLTEYSTTSVARFAALKRTAANLAPMRHSENPQFIIQNKIFDAIVTDLSKYDLETVNPYNMMLQCTTHEERVEAQRVISAVMKIEIRKGRTEKAFDYFRLLQLSYLPVDADVYALLRGKIQDAFAELLENKTSTPSLSTLNIIMNYFTETDKVPEAFTLLLAMKTVGIKPSDHTYQALLNACMRYEDTSDAMVAFDLMRDDDIVLDYAYYDRLFHLCGSSVYPLGAKTVLEEMCMRFKIPKEQRWLNTLTLYITEFMKFMQIPQSERGKRGWVTGVTIQTKLTFPPKTNNNMLLEPELSEGILQSLTSSQYGLANTNKNEFGAPFTQPSVEATERKEVEAGKDTIQSVTGGSS